MKAGRFLDFIGGTIGGWAITSVLTGLFVAIVGVAPEQWITIFVADPPDWLLSPWFKLALLLVGLALIGLSFRFNVWSRRQEAIDELAEDISWAIHNLLNRPQPSSITDTWVSKWENDYRAWCDKVSSKLENRAFFTRADQLHFDRLGFVPIVQMTADAKLNWLLGQLNLKFDRLRDVINWTQQRVR